MHDLIDFFQTNGALVIANPLPFLTFAVLFGGGGFIVGRYFLTERIANLESRIARRDDEIAALKTRKGKTAEPSLIPIMGTSAIGENDVTPMLGKWPDRRRPGTLSTPPRQRRG
ncbi:MAG: hypothetical protein EOS78_26780 [Mesorhizobium sp.]|uniref:hypothetical protein n=1 Tax=unclassified Mesorhizobium TaxID=325217 RepID=UPI000F7532A1|nr:MULTISPECIES: hypothetical protein [unclassified Mesorhizobium]AZO55689.1 hypothetical protein EJ077_21345 [Mesorhizobium sp. M8A.F.Ca.ET.057.01.1.1]RWE31068.1 MAG: hypothetical protein EOS78_26780 [Mesorhizobium sp.]RWE39695.1 MAG: hypothetical protein EOS80_31620 [Mesorhizobium sp.]TJX32979.1 MAG: hypothetical protein E5W21_29970 [Mesorhizobium sp.]